MTPGELFDALADVEHERWSDWMTYLFTQCEPQPDGGMIIPAEKVRHWQRLIETPFEQLAVHSQDSDREQVMRYWPQMVRFVAEWLGDFDDGELTREWREQMTIETGEL